MRIIPINLDQRIIIDDEDFERVSQHSWATWWNKKKKKFACPQTTIRYKTVILSRFLMNPPKDMQIDHVNRNIFDNRKSNLRICNNSLNGHNRGLFKNNKTKFMGVYYDKYHKKYRAEIKINGKKTMLGYFVFLKDAAKTYYDFKKQNVI